MSGHTPTPWAVTKGKSRKVTSQGVLICTAVLRNFATTAQNKHGKGVDEAEANARRIVAAVNATAGISTEALEAGVIAELVERIEALRDAPDADAGMDALDDLLATLAKVRGETA